MRCAALALAALLTAAPARADLFGFDDPVAELDLAFESLATGCQKLGPGRTWAALGGYGYAQGLLYYGHPGDALPLFEFAMDASRRGLGEDHEYTDRIRSNVAESLLLLGRVGEALPLLEQCMAFNVKARGEGHLATATSTNNVAAALLDVGRGGAALPLFERALAIRRKAYGDRHPDTAASYSCLAACLEWLGRPAEALPLSERALRISRDTLGDAHPDTALRANNLAGCLASLNRPAEARPHLERSLEVTRRVLGESHPDTAHRYNNLADCLITLGRPAEALPLLQRALAISRKRVGEDHPDTALYGNQVAFCLRSLGRPAEALPLHERALATLRRTRGEVHPATAAGYIRVAMCLRSLGRTAEAARPTQAALPAVEAARHMQAATGFDRAVAVDLTWPDVFLASTLARRGQPRQAFRHAEASLARGLLDDLARDDPQDARELDDLSRRIAALDAQLTPLFGSADLTPKVAAWRDRLADQRRRLTGERIAVGAAASRGHLVALEELQAALPATAALVMWVEDSGAAPLACVVRRSGDPAWVSARPQGAAWDAADGSLPHRCYLATVTTGPKADPATREAALAALRRQRVEPLLPHLKGADHVFVVPTGRMASVPVELLFPPGVTASLIPSGSLLHRTLKGHRPFAAAPMLALGDPAFAPDPPMPPESGLYLAAVVPGGAGAKSGLKAGDVIVKRGDVAMNTVDDLRKPGAAALTVWREGSVRTVKVPAGLLGVSVAGDPPRVADRRRRQAETPLALRGSGHAALPGTAFEVNAVADLVGGTTRLLGSAASEPRLDELLAAKKLKTFRVLHFATHGEVNEQLPDRSHLVLAQDRLPDALSPEGKRYDGRLTVEAIRRTWELDADLVVLSACSTGLGRNAGGDGLLGFAHAFLSRGARTVVLSRWKVDDGATGLLMVRFYENLIKRKLGRAAALADAKAWLRTLSRADAEKRVAHLTNGTLRGTEGEVPPLAKGAAPALPAGDRPYEHPFYWAAWMLVGDPD